VSKLGTFMEAQQQARQMSFEDLLATLEAEERDEAPQVIVAAVQLGADHGQIVVIEEAETGSGPHDGYPSGWLWQLDDRLPFEEAIQEARAAFERKFGMEARTVWAHPATGNGDRVTHDKRIGRGYLLLGPLPKTKEVPEIPEKTRERVLRPRLARLVANWQISEDELGGEP